MQTSTTSLAFALSALLVSMPAAAQHEDHSQHQVAEPMSAADQAQLGTVDFPISCAADAQPTFNRAVARLHSFWFPAAIEAFQEVLKADPHCGMAEWGIAMAHWGNPLGSNRPRPAVQAGWAASQRALELGATTARERDYIAAIDHLYANHETSDDLSRARSYERAMERLVTTYPDDSEAAIFYAMALNGTADLNDKTYANQLKAAAILEREFAKQPNHPGIAHYIIHSYDVPPLAGRALDAAMAYAKIAPAAPHALHMPSHTFTRLGYWQNSIDTNIRSAEAALEANSPAEALHAMDYMVYAYLQTGQDAAAQDVVQQMREIGRQVDPQGGYGLAGFYAMAAIDARYALERSDWAAAADLPTRRTVPFVDAISHFARAVGAARAGQPAEARADLAMVARARDALAAGSYWAQQIEIQRMAAEAWIELAEGNSARAIELMRAAADTEDGTEKSAISPGPIAPARELLGDMLLELDRPAEALVAYEATAAKEPGRFRGIYCAPTADERTGDDEKARLYYRQLVEICERADADVRPELAQARRFVG